MTKTVQDYLNEVSYQALNTYKPSEFAIRFINFVKLVNGSQGEENKTPVMHYKMLDGVVSSYKQVANMCFRGSAKTTLLGEYLILYLAVFGDLPTLGKVELALYVTDSIDNGVKSMRKNLEYRLENSEFLKHYIPDTKFTDIRWEFTNKDGNKFIVKAYGAKSGVRGVKEQGKRPKLALLDDLVSDDDARSPTVLESIKATVHEAVINALHPRKQKIIWLGTPFNANDPLYEAIESGAWYVSVYPVCEKFPCTREEFNGAWGDRFDYDYVRLRYESALAVGRVNGFYQELMLQIMNDDEKLILDEDIQWYSLPNLLENKSNFNFYITTDFATSQKSSADYSFISVWAVNHKGFYFWVDGICARQLMDKNIDDLFSLVCKYNPISVGIETTGQQGGFISWINKEMFHRNIFFSLASQANNTTQGIRPVTDKLSRFNVIVPDFKTKKFYFPMEKKHTIALKEMMLELEQATVSGFRSKHDDALDTISMLTSMQIWLPSNEVAMTKTNGIWDTVEDNTVNNMASYIV